MCSRYIIPRCNLAATETESLHRCFHLCRAIAVPLVGLHSFVSVHFVSPVMLKSVVWRPHVLLDPALLDGVALLEPCLHLLRPIVSCASANGAAEWLGVYGCISRSTCQMLMSMATVESQVELVCDAPRAGHESCELLGAHVVAEIVKSALSRYTRWSIFMVILLGNFQGPPVDGCSCRPWFN